MKSKTDKSMDRGAQRFRIYAILVLCIFVVITGSLFAVKSFQNREVAGGIGGIVIALTIIAFAIFFFIRGNRDLAKGIPLHDERSRRVLEKASSRAFYVSLYVLLALGFLSEDLIPFRDVSQATGITVGIMALLFLGFWAYYNRKEM